MSLTLIAMVSSVFGQAVEPSNDQTIITDMTNYQEFQMAGNADESGSAVDATTTICYVTQSGTFDLIDLDNTESDPAVRYASASTAIVHYIPLITAPDPVINAGAWTYPTITTANLKSTWDWTETVGATGSTLIDPSNVPAGFIALSANHTASNYVQKYITVGTTAGAMTFDVYEESRDALGALLCDDSGSPASIDVTSIAPPSVAVVTAEDTEDCIGNVEDSPLTLTIRVTGTAPFHLGLSYTRTTDPDGTPTVEYDFRDILVSAAGAATFVDDANGATVINEDIFAGTATDNGDGTWDLTIPIVVDNDGDDAHASDATGNADYGLNGGAVTQHELEIEYVNDRISRSSDRWTPADPNTTPEIHVLYTATADIDMIVKLYPTPITGNIFTIPN